MKCALEPEEGETGKSSRVVVGGGPWKIVARTKPTESGCGRSDHAS